MKQKKKNEIYKVFQGCKQSWAFVLGKKKVRNITDVVFQNKIILILLEHMSKITSTNEYLECPYYQNK